MLIPKTENRKLALISLTVLIGIAVFGLFNIVRAAGTLTQITATPSDVTAGANSNYTIVFKTATNITAGGKITIQFPGGFDINGSDDLLDYTDMDLANGGADLTLAATPSGATWGASISGQIITFLSGTGTIAAGSIVTVEIGTNATSGATGDKQIVNTSTTASNHQVTITTKDSVDTVLDGPTSSIYFQIFSVHSESAIGDTIYYLTERNQTHYQAQGNIQMGGRDAGVLSKTAPTFDETAFCTTWVQFWFDEDGTYTQTNEITNIYYHIWWASSVPTIPDPPKLGYDTIGEWGDDLDESFTIDPDNSPNKVGSHYLYAGKKTVSADIFGNAIYNFGIKYLSTNNYPSIISSPDRMSYIILNLPANTTLQGRDSDQDGLSDYLELITYHTNPYDTDTDNDGYNDGDEVANGMNPLDPDSAPTFGRVVKQYNGGTKSYTFGSSVSSISDIDGDGKDDVLIGAPAGGATGFVYIYSSGTGNLLKQYTGSGYFGSSISSISDIDGDGKDDVLIGAYNANSVYLYSSGTGNLLKQYTGSGSFGSSVSSISDIDGDGKDDVLIGARDANSSTGSVYIYSTKSPEYALFKQYDGVAAGDKFGSVSSISDIDGDGKADVLIGAPNADPGGKSNAGSAYLYSSNTGNLLKQYNGGAASYNFGSPISSISDIDDDTNEKDDVLVGARGADSVYIYSSTESSTTPLKQYNGTLPQEATGIVTNDFGSSVSSISDIDGDGKDDVLVGDRGFPSSGLAAAGSAFIYSSGTGNLLKQYNGGGPNDNFGSSVSKISDIDGDGKDDVLVGAPNADPGGKSNAGSAYIYSSGTGNIPTQSWPQDTSKNNAFDLDNYFADPNNLTLPARNQIISYEPSIDDNPMIDVTIDADNKVSFSQPAGWIGTETVVFTATDSTNLFSESNTVTLTVEDTTSPTDVGISSITADSTSQITVTANTATDSESGLHSTPYYFDRDSGTANSGWQTSTTFIDTGLSCGTTYTYKVKVRDAAGNISDYSSSVSATTLGCGRPPSRRKAPTPIYEKEIPEEKSIVEIPEIIKKIPEIIKEIISPKPPEEIKPPEVPIEELVPKEAPLAFQSKWWLITYTLKNKPLVKFTQASLPAEIKQLAEKFPELGKTLKEVGITKITDIEKLKTVKLTLPGLKKLEEMPTEIVFAKTGGELIDFNIILSVTEKGEPQQKITIISGKPLQLTVKPDQPAKSVKGYIIFKSKKPREDSSYLPLNQLTASLIFASPVFAKSQEKPVRVEEKLVLLEFEYTDPDGDGIYTAEIQAPVVEGEYEIITVMDFEDPDLGKKEIRLVTVVDPEGYIYTQLPQGKLRVAGAIVSLYWLNPETKQYEPWSAKEYQQENPQITDDTSKYSFLVPPGTYYLKVEHPAYPVYQSDVFVVKEGSGIHMNIELKTKYWWLRYFDWKIIIMIIFGVLLLYNFYRDKIRERLIRKS